MVNTYATRRFWDRVAQIRNDMDNSRNDYEKRAAAIEQAVAEIVSDACWPWFDHQPHDISRG